MSAPASATDGSRGESWALPLACGMLNEWFDSPIELTSALAGAGADAGASVGADVDSKMSAELRGLLTAALVDWLVKPTPTLDCTPVTPG
jgi:hypothetical protein